MPKHFSKPSVWVIYNPNSTGDSKELAFKFAARLKKASIPATCIATEYAGHAEKLAKDIAESKKNPIIFSSSGDGGYNEVINGVMHSSVPSTICGVLPAGNANDHHNALHRGNTIHRVAQGDADAIDCIEVDLGGKKRYAHSYVGLGLTPQIGKELTKRKLSPLVEAWVVLVKLFQITPVKISIDGLTKVYDHLVITNISQMSKYITVAPNADVTDGKLELSTVKSGSFIRLLQHLLRRVIRENAEPKQISEFTFRCLRPTSLQLDGEVISLKKGHNIHIRCAPKLLRTIV